jgi:alanine-glyoxylate transaminase/serine-glyoxylate transaminase/serine-pyruvate transaminase
MRGYEEGKPVYFATPPIQLICALQVSLKEITSRPIEERWAKNKQASIDFKQFVTNELGLKQVSFVKTLFCYIFDHYFL